MTGRPARIKRNAIRCTTCHTTIESKHRHDFVWCPCRKVAVDGGREYLKRVGSRYEECSEVEA